MTASEHDRSRALLAEGWRDLQEGRASDAALSFERLLLHDPGLEEARTGLDRARSALSETDRLRSLQADSGPISKVRGAFFFSRAAALDPEPDAPSLPPGRPGWSRPLLVAAWVTLFAVLGAGLAAGWGRLFQTLTRRPAPATRQASVESSETRQADAARPGGDR